MSIPQGKEKFECVYSYVLLKFKSWYKIRDKNVFLYTVPSILKFKVSLNYCVGVKEKLPKQSYKNQDKDSEAEKL